MIVEMGGGVLRSSGVGIARTADGLEVCDGPESLKDHLLQMPPLGEGEVDLRQEPAMRKDGGKIRYDLIPADALHELARVYTKGAVKYADRNWEKGMSWSRCFGSAMRHLWKFWRGERYDPDTGCHHAAMAAWNCLALCSYDFRKIGTDDRWQIDQNNEAFRD